MKTSNYNAGLEKLRVLLVQGPSDSDNVQEIIKARDAVVAQYQPVFTPEGVKNLDAERFKSFLLFENNRHWYGLHRQGGRICSNMGQLRSALALLLDEQRPITERWDSVTGMVRGMGRAIMSAILMIAHPDLYGVWNNTSEAGLKMLGLWPEFTHGTNIGEKYAAVNSLLIRLAKDLQIDLWTLDALFWRLKMKSGNGEPPPPGPGIEGIGADAQQSFGLERHLHDFLFENWDKTELGKEWELYAENGDIERAYEYPTGVGNIDLLAKHHKGSRWLVVELKRGQTSDETLGQVLRYIGWVTNKLASPGESVEGLIIARYVDDKLRYAVSIVPCVKLMEYEVSFRLHAAKPLETTRPDQPDVALGG